MQIYSQLNRNNVRLWMLCIEVWESARRGAASVVVEALNDEAVRFYQRFEFQAFPDQPYKLFRTMTSIAKTFDN